MEKDIMNEPLYGERSYVKSISAGLRLPLRHPWGFLRHLWPLLLLCVATWGFVAKFVAGDLSVFLQLLDQPDVTTSSLVDMPLFRLMGWGALSMVFLGVQCGQIAHLMTRYGALTYFPAVHPWQVFRSIVPHILRGLLLCLVGYAVVCALAVLSLYVMPSMFWSSLLFVVLLITWAFLYIPVGQRYLYSNHNFLSSLTSAFSHPNLLGGNFSITIVCGLLVFVVTFIGCLPALSTTYVGLISDQALAVGDTSDLPESFSLIRAVTYSLAAMVCFMSWPFILVPLTFHWGASEKRSSDSN